MGIQTGLDLLRIYFADHDSCDMNTVNQVLNWVISLAKKMLQYKPNAAFS